MHESASEVNQLIATFLWLQVYTYKHAWLAKIWPFFSDDDDDDDDNDDNR